MRIINRPPYYKNQEAASFVSEDFLGAIHPYSTDLFVLRVYDFDHQLQGEVTLETKEILVLSEEEEAYLAPAVSCYFSEVNLRRLAEITGLNGYGQQALLFLFQLKILEHLFFFCEDQGAEKLILTINDDTLDYLEVYSPFFASESFVIQENGEHQTQVTIPVSPLTYQGLLGFMGRLEQDLRKILWQEQSGNPTVREYLKRHACV